MKVSSQGRKEMLRSPFLPEWFKTIESQQIWDELLTNTELLLHYQNQLGHPWYERVLWEVYRTFTKAG